MVHVALMLVLATVPDAPGIDPELEALVEDVLEQEGSVILAQARIEELGDGLSWELGATSGTGTVRRWLPAVALRLTWRPPGRSGRGTWEFVMLVSWPLGG